MNIQEYLFMVKYIENNSKITLDDASVTSLHLSAIYYNQKIEHGPIVS